MCEQPLMASSFLCPSCIQDVVVRRCVGAVYWTAPESAIREAVAQATEALVSRYNADQGIPELCSALERKVQEQNGLPGVRVPQLP